MADTDRDILIIVREKVSSLHEELIGSPNRKGRIPILEETQDKHSAQINFWRGGIAITGFLVLAFGALLITHILGGK